MEKRKNIKLYKTNIENSPTYTIKCCSDRVKIETAEKIVVCNATNNKLLEISTSGGITIF